MEQFALWGAIVNAVVVVIGSLIGLLVREIAHRFGKEKESGKESPLADHLFHAIGLAVIWIGLSGALEGTVRAVILGTVDSANTSVQKNETLIVILSMAIGALIGHFLNLDGMMNRLGAWLESKVGGKTGGISRGFVAASLLFCVGAMSINGAFASGVSHDHSIQYAKALIDGISAVVLTTTLGVGVAFSGVFIFLYQGGLSLIASAFGSVLSPMMILEMNVVGSLLIVAIGTNVMGITKIKAMNLLPAMFLPIGLCPLFDLIF